MNDDDVSLYMRQVCPACGGRVLSCGLDWMLSPEGRASDVVRRTPGLLLAAQEFAASGWGADGEALVWACTGACKAYSFTVEGTSDMDGMGDHDGAAFGL